MGTERSRPGTAKLLPLAAVLLASCVTGAAGPTALPPWQTRMGREHPLVGRVWDVGAARFVDASTLAARLARERFVLLGERHDNPDHHRLQAWVVRALAAAGRRPAVGFEMLGLDQAPALARHLVAAPRDAAGLGEAVGWARSGWPDWTMYQPIAEAALAAGLRIVAANLSAASTQAMRRDGLAALDPGLVARHGIDRPLPAEAERAMADEIRDSHCNQAPEAIIPRMIAAQRARDAQMAESLLGATGAVGAAAGAAGAAESTGAGAVLIAGSGHVRTDHGVPVYLRSLQPAASIASVGFVEVRDGEMAPEAYASSFHRKALPFDYVWFTPRVDDEDACEKFKKALERLRQQR